MLKKADILVILLNWNASDLTLSCVENLRQWELPIDILLVDNASSDAEKEKLKEVDSLVKIIYAKENRGFAGGTNLGIQYALVEKYPYVVLMNTDALVSEGIMEGLAQNIQADSAIGIMGPCMQEGTAHKFKTYIGGKDIAYHVDTRNLSREVNIKTNSIVEVAYVPGTLCMIRTMALERIGLLDADYFFSGEIADLCKRLRTANYKVLVDTSLLIQHFTDKTDSELRAGLYLYYSLRNRFLYSQKHYPKQKNRLYRKWLWVGIRQLIGAVVTLNFTTTKALVWAMLDGVLGRFGNRNYRF